MFAPSFEEQEELLKECVERALAGNETPLRVLEAGCGRRWIFAGLALPAHLTGVDIDAEALHARLAVSKDLDVGILGDIRTVDFGSRKFDMVFSAYVLEHVSGASEVLRNFWDLLEPGGVLVLLIPDGDSAKGLLTRLAPFRLHVAYYRWVLGSKNAGKAGFAPYPTVYDSIVTRSGIRAFSGEFGGEILAEVTVQTAPQQYGRLGPLAVALLRLVDFFSRGRYTSEYCEIGFVVRKPLAD